MQRADRLYVEAGRLLEKGLSLRAILPNDADVVATRLAIPAFGIDVVVRAELAEPVSGEENLVRRVVRDHHLRPMHHRRGYERKPVPPELQRIPFLHDKALRGYRFAKELLHEPERLRGGHNRRAAPLLQSHGYACGMVRLHVVYHEIVGGFAARRRLDVLQPFAAKAGIDGVHHRRLRVIDEVAVVRHAARHGVLPLEKVDLVVVHSNVDNVI